MLIPYKKLIEKYSIRPTGVCHIGANTGQEAPDYYSNGVEQTVWFEADPELISPLTTQLQPYSNCAVFNSCLSDTDGEEVILNIANNGGQSSSILQLDYHKIAHPEVHYTKEVVVKTHRLASIFTMHNLHIEDYPFVNIDIQGAELLALKGFGNLLHKVKYLYVEVNDANLYTGCPLFPELRDYLAEYGFYLREKVMSGNHGWGDAFFTKNNI